MNINQVNKIVDAIISSPTPNYTKEYAQEILRSCGILDENNEIMPVYRDIITEDKSCCYKCEHDWVYIGLDEYRCNKCRARRYT